MRRGRRRGISHVHRGLLDTLARKERLLDVAEMGKGSLKGSIAAGGGSIGGWGRKLYSSKKFGSGLM